ARPHSHRTLLSSPSLLPPLLFSFYCYVHHRALHSFPTRRSSDLSSSFLRVNSAFASARRLGSANKSRNVPATVLPVTLIVGAIVSGIPPSAFITHAG